MNKRELLELIKEAPEDADIFIAVWEVNKDIDNEKYDYLANRIQYLKEENFIRIATYLYVDGN